MKKINVLIISFLFLLSNNIQASLFQGPNPYSFGPQGRAVADLRDFAKPKQMANILAGRPVVATKSDGTRVYYTSDGKMSLSIKENGEMTFSLGGHSKSMDKFGNLKSEAKTFKGNFQEIKNEFGEIQSYNQLDGNGKVISSYDKDMNKTATFNYGKFGKSLEYSVNEMTKQKTVYDNNERAVAVYDADGYILTTYQYEDVSYESSEDRKTLITIENDNKGDRALMTVKNYSHVIDSLNSNASFNGKMSHTTTYYDKEGLMTYIDDANGLTSNVYYYKQDEKGNKVLDYVLDTKTKNKTYYENNKQIYVKNDKGAYITRYYWEGSKYLFSAELGSDGSWLSTTNKDNVTTASNIVYNDDGTINTVSEKGVITEKYFYKEDSEGNSILDYVENVIDGSKTFYDENGCSIKTVDIKGNILTDYSWNKGNLVYSFDRESGITKWYVQGEENKPVVIYESLDNRIISKNIYSDGQLIGKWTVAHGSVVSDNQDGAGNINDREYTLTIYANERQEFVLQFKEEPTLDQVRYILNKYISTGIMATDTVYNNGNKIGEWEYVKRFNEENLGGYKLIYKLKIYTEDNDSFEVEYEGKPGDEPTVEVINKYLAQYKK